MPAFIINACQRLLNLTHSLDWLAPLVMRLFFGYFWAETGWAKLHNQEGAVARFIDWGIPFPEFNAAFSAGTELVGGLLIMLGLFTQLISIPMIINMVVAIALVVIKNVSDFDEFVELDEFLYILIFLWLMMAGPGRVSVDAVLARKLGLATNSHV